MHYIYRVINTINGFIYIGYTSNKPEKRLLEHISASRRTKTCQLITKAIKKYGIDAFSIEILKTFDNKNEALLCEIDFIATLQTNRARYPDGNGYNLHDGGNVPPSQLGRKYSNRCKNGTRPTIKNGHVRTYTEEGLARHISRNQRGKTLDEIYGEEKAVEIRKKLLARKRNTKSDKIISTLNHKPEKCRAVKICFACGGSIIVTGIQNAADSLGYSIAHTSRLLSGKSRLPDGIQSICWQN